MGAKIIDGKLLAQKVKEFVKQEVEKLKLKGIIPGLAVIIVGNDPASRIYVNGKKKACEEVGIYSEEYSLPDSISQKELFELIQYLNKKPEIHGILLQHPIPNHLNEREAFNTISPNKDVDGFHPLNVGNLCIGEDCFIPCTPSGVLEMLKEYEVEIQGKECVVVGRSNIVGKPLALLLLNGNGTVTIAHSKTKNLFEVCRKADILVVAAGKPKLITGEMIKPGAVVIDVGINRLEGTNKIVGDVDFDSAKEVASLITPVPGGVGPMTIAMLLKNTLKATQMQTMLGDRE